MQISLPTQIKRLSLAAAVAAFAYQPAMLANTGSPLTTFNLPSPTAPMLDTVVSATPASVSSIKNASATATKQLAQGTPFISTAHTTTGSAQIVEANGQRYLEFDSAFRSDSGPDLFVLLHRDAQPDDYSPENYVNLGRIQELEGAQRYAIPAGVDITQFQSAVIWCQDFNVTFGYAVL